MICLTLYYACKTALASDIACCGFRVCAPAVDAHATHDESNLRGVLLDRSAVARGRHEAKLVDGRAR
jgi:hypothetical protein